RKILDFYVWGRGWPPPRDAGNVADATALTSHPKWKVISGYDDGYATLAPVGRFPANRFGLFDLAGNVAEWCNDQTDDGRVVVRGGSFTSSDRDDLLASCRLTEFPTTKRWDLGFRVIIAATP